MKRKQVQQPAPEETLGEDEDSAEFGDFEDVENAEAEEQPKVVETPIEPQKKKGKAGKMPTIEELNNLKEAEQLFKSGLFRMQVSEMLKEVRLDYERNELLESHLHKLKNVMEEIEEKDFNGATFLSEDLPRRNSDFKIRFKKPSNVQLIGSYLLRTVTKPLVNIDLAVEIPSHCFKERDIKNYVYHDKRAVYLKNLSEHLSKYEEFKNFSFETFRGDFNKVILSIELPQLTPKTEASTPIFIRIIPSISPSVFKASKLLPDKNNLNQSEKEKSSTSSALYNSSILEDCLFQEHLEYLHKLVGENPPFIESIQLLKIWLRQRGLLATDGLNGFLTSFFLAYLSQKKWISKHMSSYQIFKNTLQFFATQNFSEGFFLKEDMSGEEKKVFLDNFEAVFVDPSGNYNLFSRVSKQYIDELRNESISGVDLLNNPKMDPFQILFMTPSLFFAKYDFFLRIHRIPADEQEEYLKKLENVLRQGLSDRITDLRFFPKNEISWKVGSNLSEMIAKREISVGFHLNPARWKSKINMGPSADLTSEVEDFKNFWGEKAERRHFKDGKVIFAAVWESEPPHVIVGLIVEHLLKRHLLITSSHNLSIIHSQFLFTKKKSTKSQQEKWRAELGDEMEDSRRVIAYEKLSTKLRAISEIPLSIQSIHPISPGLRYTDPFGPSMVMKATEGTWLEPLTVAIQFEGSGSWPEDIQAIGALKGGFYVAMSQALNSKWNPHGLQAHPTPHSLDVITEDGFPFRVVIYHPGEARIVSRGNQSDNVTDLELLDAKRIHGSFFHGFHMKYPAFGSSVKLAWKWLNAHLLGGWISIEVIEMLMAYLFHNPSPYTSPKTPLIAFYRFLSFFGTFDFEKNPIILDLENEMSEEDIENIQKNFEQARENMSQQYAIFLATPRDPHSNFWTKNNPPRNILKRSQEFAKQAENILKNHLFLSYNPSKFNSIFIHNLEDYDVVIRLNKQILQERQASFGTSNAKLFKSKKRIHESFVNRAPLQKILFGFNPVRTFVNLLKEQFFEHMVVFYNENGGNEIALMWKPSFVFPKPFKVYNSFASFPVTKEKSRLLHVVPNWLQILQTLRELGNGLVEDVHIQK